VDGSDEFTSKVNPYEPPGLANANELAVLSKPGRAWRDGVFAVIDFRQPEVVCERCVFTGLLVRPNDRRRVDLTHTEILWFTKTRKTSWPAVPETRPHVVWSTRIGHWMTIGGVVGLLITVFCTVLFRGNPRPYFALILVWFVVGIVGAFIRQRFESKQLSIFRVVDSYGWVHGAHADFLKELPLWPGRQPE
jgi:hypothetical protein